MFDRAVLKDLWVFRNRKAGLCGYFTVDAWSVCRFTVGSGDRFSVAFRRAGCVAVVVSELVRLELVPDGRGLVGAGVWSGRL